ncbi:DUF1474 family protein [Macrococcus animalis]|uniref:type II toxin-antitoxin system toxin TscT n=1 Tax=Macrococcus animalis TaxID=3395467 RepID=UPI0039BE949F
MKNSDIEVYLETVTQDISDVQTKLNWLNDDHFVNEPRTHEERLTFSAAYNEIRIEVNQAAQLLDLYIKELNRIKDEVTTYE